MSRARKILIFVLVVAFTGGGWWLATSVLPHKHPLLRKTDEPGEAGAATSPQGGEEKRVLYWYDPMKPEQRFDRPGKSPFMDMELVPMYADDESGASTHVRIDPQMVQKLGVRTVKVERGTFFQRVDASGAVEIDERRIAAVESRATGWVEQLLVRAVGDPVKRGQALAGVYSPELFAAQQELVLAAGSGDASLISATRQRMTLLGLTPGQIEAVLKTRQAQRHALVVAPQNGVVIELNVREGGQVMPGTPLMRVADLSSVWITVEVAEAQSSRVHEGRPAEARLSALPGQVLEGRVDYIYPRLETQTRTLRVRLSFDNPQLALKPGMYAEVALFGGPRENALLIPSETLIRTGARTVVILSEGDGRFRPALVETGDERAGQTEILSGLQEGEHVVVSGQFLIDSEANLRGALARLTPSPRPSPTRGDGDKQREGEGEGAPQ
jgi:Cu(I)/Ag(I) efflux system membrane fusion protein